MTPQNKNAETCSNNTQTSSNDSYDAVNLGLHLDDHSWIQRTYDLFKATVKMSSQFSQKQQEQK